MAEPEQMGDPVAAQDQDTKAVADQLGTYFKELSAAGFHRHEALQIVLQWQSLMFLGAVGPDDQQG
jgi:hypothetical protein